MSRSTYTPPAGSKVKFAADALLIDGPMTIEQLAYAVCADQKEMTELLAIPLDREFIIKVMDEKGAAHYALAGMEIDKRFIVCPSFANVEVADSPVVRRVTQPSISPSSTALAFANPFSRKDPAKSEEPPQEEVAQPEEAASAPSVPAPPPAPEFLAGLFSNGDLVITAGDQSIKLGPKQARQLVNYLNKIDEAIAK
jgi:hypothetical protein